MEACRRRLETCKPEELVAVQGELQAYRRILNLEKSLGSDYGQPEDKGE